MRQPPAVHHTIVVTDTVNFTDPARTNLDQLAIRHALYKILKYAFAPHWPVCHTEDRGDGVLILVPPQVPKIHLATRMLTQLETALSRHNASCPAGASIRLRVALHAGEVHHDAHGVAGTAINHTFRLIDAPSVKTACNAFHAPCAIVVSAWFYDEVIHHYPSAEPDAFQAVLAETKDVTHPAWIRLACATVLNYTNG